MASSYTVCWLTDANNSERAADFAELVVTHYRDLGVSAKRMWTHNGPEYRGHSFRDRLAGMGVEHTRIKPGRPATNGHVERFHGTVLHEFYRVAFWRRYYRSVAELHGDLAGFVDWYNRRRTHSGQRIRGRIPATVFTHHANREKAA